MNIYGGWCMKPRASTNINERLWRLVHGPPWTSMDLHGPPWISMEVNLTFLEGPRYTTRPRDRNTPLGGYMCIMVPGILKWYHVYSGPGKNRGDGRGEGEFDFGKNPGICNRDHENRVRSVQFTPRGSEQKNNWGMRMG